MIYLCTRIIKPTTIYKKEDFITDFTQFEQWCKDHDYNDVNGLENCLKPYSKIRDDFYFSERSVTFYSQ